MKTVDLIRHATSKWVEKAGASPVPLFGGRMNHVDLSDRGVNEALELGQFALQQRIRPTGVLCSPALRARRTFEISAGVMKLRVPSLMDPEVQELDWGDWEGQPRSLAEVGKTRRQQRRQGPRFKPPGGESFEMVHRRAATAIRGVLDALPDGSHLWVFTHKNVIKALHATTTPQLPAAHAWWRGRRLADQIPLPRR